MRGQVSFNANLLDDGIADVVLVISEQGVQELGGVVQNLLRGIPGGFRD
jgi:hypothetical protein